MLPSLTDIGGFAATRGCTPCAAYAAIPAHPQKQYTSLWRLYLSLGGVGEKALLIGGSGSGKTRFFVKPNLMQCVSKDYPVSFIVTDPKGTLLVETGKMLEKNG